VFAASLTLYVPHVPLISRLRSIGCILSSERGSAASLLWFTYVSARRARSLVHLLLAACPSLFMDGSAACLHARIFLSAHPLAACLASCTDGSARPLVVGQSRLCRLCFIFTHPVQPGVRCWALLERDETGGRTHDPSEFTAADGTVGCSQSSSYVPLSRA